MNCYTCNKMPGPGGTNYHVRQAVGVCHNCGVGVCAEHSVKAELEGTPLLCLACAELHKSLGDTRRKEPVPVS